MYDCSNPLRGSSGLRLCPEILVSSRDTTKQAMDVSGSYKETWAVYPADDFFTAEAETFHSTSALLAEMENRDLSNRPVRYTKETFLSNSGRSLTPLSRLKSTASFAAYRGLQGGIVGGLGLGLLAAAEGTINWLTLAVGGSPGPAMALGGMLLACVTAGAVAGAVEGWMKVGHKMEESSVEGRLDQSGQSPMLTTPNGTSMKIKAGFSEQESFAQAAIVSTGHEPEIRKIQRHRDRKSTRIARYIGSKLSEQPNLRGAVAGFMAGTITGPLFPNLVLDIARQEEKDFRA